MRTFLPIPVTAAALLLAVSAPAQPGATLLDIDLSKGQSALPATARATGGEWRGGWEPTDHGQRIVIDAGRPVRNGLVEVTFTRNAWSDDAEAYKLPEWLYNTRVISITEKPDLTGEAIRFQVYARNRYEDNQGTVTAAGGLNQKVGKWSDYATDGKTPMTLRFQWKDGVITLSDVRGKPVSGGKLTAGLRYVALGETDPNRKGTALGMRFLGVRVIDLDQGAVPAGRDWTKVQIVPQKDVRLPAETVPVNARTRTVFDVDLTKGASALPKSAWVRGGQWDGGWRVNANRERIVLDPGYWIRNGVLEVSFTRKPAGAEGTEEFKIDLLAVHESPNIDHTDVHGDAIVLRIGTAEVNMGLQAGIKTFTKERAPVHFGEGWGERYGEIEEWTMDDKTPHNFRVEWRDGRLTVTDFKGRTFKCKQDCDNDLNRLRYIAIGGTRFSDGSSLIGARFLRVKLQDLDAPEQR